MMDMATHYSDWEFIGIPVTGLLGNSYDTSVAPDTLLPPNVRIEYPMGEPHKAPLQDNSVDLVNISAQGLLFGNSHWQCALKEIYRILKPGGLLQVVDLHNAPVGTVLIESFIDTVRNILKGLDKDYDDALHLSTLLPASGFQVIQTMNKQVNFGNDSSLGQEFIGITLRMFASVQSILGPRMGLEADDYQQRVEMVCAQCVQYNAHMNWLGYVARKSID
ncbi:hypothetical protein BDF14DRAFT_292210 [Spinellus fusiger]|nr:hypothetical protein BDF14DRAFT_292210 [Spinellus fusiger]